MSYVKLESFDLFYEIHGTGEPLVLISGFASGAWIWYRQIEELAKDFKVITFDPRGVGQSVISTDTTVSIEAIADDTARLLDELEIKKANLLGASFGGFVAQEFALKHSDKLKKLILACTSFGGANHIAPNTEVLAAFAPQSGASSFERVRRFMLPAFTKKFAAENNNEIEKVCKLREASDVPDAVYLQQLTAATTFNTENRLSVIKNETLILTGDSDLVVPPQNSENLAKAIPNSQLKIVEDGSHMFFIEKADVFNKTVKNFVLSH